MKRFLILGAAIAGLTLATAGARAQSWTGPEIGLQGGGALGNLTGHMHDTVHGVNLNYNPSPAGGLFGGHIGYDWQFGNIVAGIEGDAEGADVSQSVNRTAFPSFHMNTDMDFDASVRGRLGLALDRFMVYGTGGVAFGDLDNKYVYLGHPYSQSGIQTGWTAGVGFDYALTPNWLVGAEYRYTDLGDQTITPAAGISSRESYNFNAIRLRVSYRFGAPPPPPPPMAPMPAAAPAPAPPPPPRTFLVFFGFDRYNLTADARKTLEAAAFTFRKSGIAKINVSGYTDLAGTQAYNLRLSHRRAEAVSAYLARRGVPRRVMVVRWFGKEHPRVPTPNGVREPQNRRVEIVMP
ncbi:MAG: OmpA family protein [Stellaceae bacterium]